MLQEHVLALYMHSLLHTFSSMQQVNLELVKDMIKPYYLLDTYVILQMSYYFNILLTFITLLIYFDWRIRFMTRQNIITICINSMSSINNPV